MLDFFYKIRHFLPLSTLLTLYKSLFEPHITYCNIIWCNTYPSHLLKLQSLQKKIIRAISWSKFNAPTASLFHSYGLLKLPEINTYHNACTMYQVVNNMNTRLCELVPISRPLHTHYTRKKHLITGKVRKLKSTSLSIVSRFPLSAVERVEAAFGVLPVVWQLFSWGLERRGANKLLDSSCRYSTSVICRNLRSSIEGASLLSLAVWRKTDWPRFSPLSVCVLSVVSNAE